MKFVKKNVKMKMVVSEKKVIKNCTCWPIKWTKTDIHCRTITQTKTDRQPYTASVWLHYQSLLSLLLFLHPQPHPNWNAKLPLHFPPFLSKSPQHPDSPYTSWHSLILTMRLTRHYQCHGEQLQIDRLFLTLKMPVRRPPDFLTPSISVSMVIIVL